MAGSSSSQKAFKEMIQEEMQQDLEKKGWHHRDLKNREIETSCYYHIMDSGRKCRSDQLKESRDPSQIAILV
ncbi:hypothetical protein Tco_0615663 [Tanacetum coccineum]